MARTFLALCAIVLGVAGSPAPAIPPPELPKQTAVQAQVVERAGRIANATFSSELAKVVAMIESKEFRGFLRDLDDGSALYNLSSSELLQRMENELSTAEVVHNFGYHDDANCGMDVTLESADGAPYFYNQWLLQALGIVPVDGANNIFTESSETRYFGFPAFGNASAPDVKTASDRLVYGALNMFRSAAGNPQCGPVAAIFSRSYIGEQAIVAPVDTGLFVGTCGDNQTSGWIGVKCHAWKGDGGVLGVPSKAVQLLNTFTNFWNSTAAVVGDDYPIYNLARVATRLLSRNTYQPDFRDVAMNLTWVEGTLGYLELNPAITIRYPDGIKMMVGSFDSWFGTPSGDKLRQWCIAQGWPLAWAHNPLDSLYKCDPDPTKGCKPPPPYTYSHGVETSNVRVLDPAVLSKVGEGHNVTATDTEARAFESAWAAAATAVPASTPYAKRYEFLDPIWTALVRGNATWNGLQSGGLAIEPVFAGACASEACVGVRVVDGSCVCKA